jgi:hypothetical protein
MEFVVAEVLRKGAPPCRCCTFCRDDWKEAVGGGIDPSEGRFVEAEVEDVEQFAIFEVAEIVFVTLGR